MIETRFRISPQAPSKATFHISFGVTPATATQPHAHHWAATPIAVPESQRYYWTRRWQDDELESRRELLAGQGCEFDDPADAIAWLRAGD
jgi:hypothetical protein